ncbi:MAG: hydrogenase expression/formation protein HypE [Candidatus Omnitrophota bacterium]
MIEKQTSNFTLSCPISLTDYPAVTLAHGGGGKLMHDLIQKMFAATFGDCVLQSSSDAAILNIPTEKLAFTTDSFVVKPLFFPGGDIGSLAVYGTVNDLSMVGARPLYLSVGLILEEGLPMETLWKVVKSIHQAAQKSGVSIVTGDTKVVDKGKGDGIFINTTGIGTLERGKVLLPANIQKGDQIIINGDIGRHGIAIMAVREGLEFESAIESDAAPLAELVGKLLSENIEIHCLRDLTRGGLASALNEIALAANIAIAIDENKISVREDVQGACEILGFDPLYVANEGRFVAFVAAKDAQRALKIVSAHPQGAGAVCVGEVVDGAVPMVTMKSKIGAMRIIDMLSGEQLPRIC